MENETQGLLKRLKEAIIYYEKAIKVAPKEEKKLIAEIQKKQGIAQKKVDEFDLFEAKLMENTADTRMHSFHFEEAISCYKKAIKLTPKGEKEQLKKLRRKLNIAQKRLKSPFDIM